MRLSLQSGIEAIQNYLNSNVAYPFFVAVDNSDDIARIVKQLPSNFACVSTSQYCQVDSYPDYDLLLADLIGKKENVVLLGLGESALFSLDYSFWGKLKDTARAYKTVVIARCGSAKCKDLKAVDSKFGDLRWCELESSLDLSVVKVEKTVKIAAIDGFKALLETLEANKPGKHYVHTDLNIANSAYVKNAYSAITENDPSFTVDETALAPEQWAAYLANNKLAGYPLRHWRTYLRMLINGTKSPYLSLALRKATSYEQYDTALLCALLDVGHTAPKFHDYYVERKKLMKEWQEHELFSYVLMTKSKDRDRIYYLTDNTKIERRAIIEEISHLGEIPKILEQIYPDLYSYLQIYRFSNDDDGFLSNYFERYKFQKVTNCISNEFLDLVNSIAAPGERKYNFLPTRNSIILQCRAKTSGLYWIDALGVEYLAFIQRKAKELKLRISIQIARATLPTLTTLNRNFYDEWPYYRFDKNPYLDNLKHDGTGAVGIKSTDPPVHLADELTVITDALVEIKEALTKHVVDEVILASDHGASRLCVLNQKENKWEMQEKGKHSGRCCIKSEIDEKPTSATESQGFWVLANYDRFKGGMPANVEVHGGASLEEVIVPIIRVSTDSQQVECSFMSKTDNGTGMIIKPLDGFSKMEIYCPKENAKLIARIRGKDYAGKQDSINKNKFVFTLEGHFIVGSEYTALFFDGDNELNALPFRMIREKGAKKNKSDGTDFFM